MAHQPYACFANLSNFLSEKLSGDLCLMLYCRPGRAGWATRATCEADLDTSNPDVVIQITNQSIYLYYVELKLRKCVSELNVLHGIFAADIFWQTLY